MEGSSGPQEDDLAMTPGFEEALGLWERAELSRDELARRFPDEDIAGVLDAFDRMSAAAVGPTPDAGAAWEAMRARLPVRVADGRRGSGKAIRLLAAAMIAVLVLGATAYAVVPSARRAMNDAAGASTGEPDRSPTTMRPGEGTGSGTDQPTHDIPGDDASTTGSDDGAKVEEDTEAEADDESNSGSNDDGDESDSGSGANDGSTGDEGSEDASGGSSSGSEEKDAGDGENVSSGSDEPDS
jgi:hypothetical protein